MGQHDGKSLWPYLPSCITRFWRHVDRNGPEVAHDPSLGRCWIWTASRVESTGYGQFNAVGGTPPTRRIVSTHRAAYEISIGAIPFGNLVRHACDNRACVNPGHLRLGTQKENARDMMVRGRCARTRLTVEQVLAIRADPANQYDIARRYGIWQAHVSMIKRRKVWTHI